MLRSLDKFTCNRQQSPSNGEEVEASLVVPRHEKNPGFGIVENAMVDAAATGALQAPSLASSSSSGQGPVNDTNAGPVVPTAAALADCEGHPLTPLTPWQRCGEW